MASPANEMSANYRRDITKGIHNMQNNPVDEFNANQGYLYLILEQMSKWDYYTGQGINGDKNCPDYFNVLCDIIMNIMEKMSAKIDESMENEIEKEILSYKKAIKSIFIHNPHSNKTMMDENQAEILNLRLSRLYRKLMRQLQKLGMLTKVNPDPKLAMSDIE